MYMNSNNYYGTGVIKDKVKSSNNIVYDKKNRE